MGEHVVSPESLDLLGDLLLTMGLGLLLGLERQRAGKEIGLRTFSFTALAGFLTWQISATFAMATLAFVAVIVVVMNLQSLQRQSGVEMTTSVTLYLAAIVGILVAMGQLFAAVAVVMLMLILLSWKEQMVGFTEHLTQSEIQAAITLGLLAFVILPVLPNGPIDPWGLFDLRKIWLMVVLISAIGFGNYVLLRLYGAKSLSYGGFFGGLVNSTATMAELAQRAKGGGEDIEGFSFRGIMWSKTAMFLRNGIILALFAPKALPAGLLPVGMMLVVNFFLSLGGRAKADPTPSDEDEDQPLEIALSSPFSLKSALNFGLIFAALTAIGGLAQRFAGDLGFYAVSFAGGLVSSSSTTATAANLAGLGKITPLVAGSAVVLTSIASSIVSLPLVWRLSQSPRLLRRISIATGLVILAAIIGVSLNPWFLDLLGL